MAVSNSQHWKIRKRTWGIKYLSQGHTASAQWNWDSSPGFSGSRALAAFATLVTEKAIYRKILAKEMDRFFKKRIGTV